ncbi:MAG: CapA family protein [Deltaproteobacteria bacterium]|nr:CapA family protein [Deltaproteobacteria bacterium]
MGGEFAELVSRGHATWSSPFAEVSGLFQDADMRMGNLESPLFKSASPRPKKNLLHAPGEAVQALMYLGFTALNLANNHITDQSDEGLDHTRRLLAAARIHSFGAAATLEQAMSWPRICVKGHYFNMLGYAVIGEDVGAVAASAESAGCVPFSLERAESDIAAVRERGEDALVSIHWGYQEDELPSPDQIKAAHRLIDAGALIVHGHHPHVLQGFERYRNGVILYSLGNFIFSDFRRADGVKIHFPERSKRTGAAVCTIGDAGVESLSFVPMTYTRPGRLQLLKGYRAKKAIYAQETRSKHIRKPDYAYLWQHHHGRTVQTRKLQEARIYLASKARYLQSRLQQSGAPILLRLRPRHFVAALRLCERYVRHRL